jgi:hypothetical protein
MLESEGGKTKFLLLKVNERNNVIHQVGSNRTSGRKRKTKKIFDPSIEGRNSVYDSLLEAQNEMIENGKIDLDPDILLLLSEPSRNEGAKIKNTRYNRRNRTKEQVHNEHIELDPPKSAPERKKFQRGKFACPEHKRKHIKCPEDCKMRLYTIDGIYIQPNKNIEQTQPQEPSKSSIRSKKKLRSSKKEEDAPSIDESSSYAKATLPKMKNEKKKIKSLPVQDDNTEYIDIDEFTIVASSRDESVN